MTRSWLPDDPAPAGAALDWWRPADVTRQLREEPDWSRLVYIVVDELHAGVAGLVASPWPRVDDRGRLRFGSEDEAVRIAARADALIALLREQRAPIVKAPVDDAALEELRTRKLTIGDVFAARVRGPQADEPADDAPADPRTWIRGRILDITAQAREVAKAQAAAAAAGVMDESLLAVIRSESGEDVGAPPGGTAAKPPRRAPRAIRLLADEEVARTREEVERKLQDLARGKGDTEADEEGPEPEKA